MVEEIYGEKRINGSKDLYDRVCGWLADHDYLGSPEAEKTGGMLMEEAEYLLEDIYKSCGGVE